MSMRNTVLLGIMAVLAATAPACTQETQEKTKDGPRTLSQVEATVSEIPLAKAHLEGNSQIKWDSGEVIGVFSDIQSPVPFSRANDGNVFMSDTPVKGNEFYAFYPYGDSCFDPSNPKVLHFSIDNGTTTGGKSPRLLVPMIAKAEGNHFSFKQTCGILHFSITGTRQLTSVCLKGNNEERLGGEYTVNLEESMPVLKGDGVNDNMRFSPASPIQLSESEAYDVYFLLPPMQFEKGFSLELGYQDASICKITEKAVTISRAVITSYYVDLDGTLKEEEDAIALERNALIELFNTMDGPNWGWHRDWCSSLPVGEWEGVYTNEKGYVYRIDLAGNSLRGQVSQAISLLSRLEHLEILWLQANDLTGPIPPEIKNLKNLKHLELWGTPLSGSIPEEMGELTHLEVLLLNSNPNLTGPIPPSIGNLTNLKWIRLSDCNLTGNIPEEITRLHNLEYPFESWGNELLSGTVPPAFGQWEYWNDYWGYIMQGTGLEFGDAVPQCPNFSVTLPDGTVKTADMLKNNKLTILFQWATWCGFSAQFLPIIKSAYRHFKQNGLEILSWADATENEEAIFQYIADNGILWPNFIAKGPDSNGAGGNQIKNYLFPKMDNNAYYPYRSFPSVNAFDSNGKLVYTNANSNQMETFVPFMDAWFDSDWKGDDESMYESSDYSRDGQVTQLQAASEGKGIDVIIMGDAYSDRLLANGTYSQQIQRTEEAFFSQEPYKSLRDRFNVFSVDVVSKNEFVMGETALSTNWESGRTNTLGGDSGKVFEYARKAVSDEAMDDAVIIVIMNVSTDIGGTCHMFGCPGGDYGRGVTISYIPAITDTENLSYTVSHEAGGHGFAKLADEYSLQLGSIPQDVVDYYVSCEPSGWWKNVDFTDNPQTVKWAAFISDDSYSSENIGVYQGGATYDYGVFRPTYNSTMRAQGDEQYNAPSRYAIWYRINKLAYGEGWTGTYSDFAAWDHAHPVSAAAAPAQKMNSVQKTFPPLAPPVIVSHSWREE